MPLVQLYLLWGKLVDFLFRLMILIAFCSFFPCSLTVVHRDMQWKSEHFSVFSWSNWLFPYCHYTDPLTMSNLLYFYLGIIHLIRKNCISHRATFGLVFKMLELSCSVPGPEHYIWCITRICDKWKQNCFCFDFHISAEQFKLAILSNPISSTLFRDQTHEPSVQTYELLLVLPLKKN